MATKAVTVKMGQSLKDIAIQYYGTPQALFRLATLNKIKPTQILKPGNDIMVEEITNDTTRYFADKKITVATYEEGLNGGIGYMEIGNDFKVS